MGHLTEAAEIIATEIVTNAINAVPPGTTGLAIVYAILDAITERWGLWPTPSGGKVAYATLPAISAT